MDIRQSWKKSLSYSLAGKQKLFWLIALGALLRSWRVLLTQWWPLVLGLCISYGVSLFYSVEYYGHVFVSVGFLLLAILSTRSSIRNKGYIYLSEKACHCLVIMPVIIGISLLINRMHLPSVVSRSLMLVPGYIVYGPLVIGTLLFFFDASCTLIHLGTSFIRSLRLVFFNYPFMLLSFAACVFIQHGARFVLVSYLSDLYVNLAVTALGIFTLVIYVSLISTVYMHLIHEQFDDYNAESEITCIMMLHSLVSWTMIVVISTLFIVPLYLLLVLSDKAGIIARAYFWWEYLYCWFILKATLIPIRVKGLENIPDYPAIIIANHQSSLDIPLLVTLFRGQPHVWLAHKALMKSFFLRFILPKVAVLVDTDTPMTAMRSLLSIQKTVDHKAKHIVVFPEGGRYTDGSVHDFFAGYVILAKKLKKSVVPVYIHGFNEVFPPHTIWARFVPVNVLVGEPFMQHENESDEDFNNRIQAWFNAHYQKMKES